VGTIYTIAGFVWIITSMLVILSLAIVPDPPTFPFLPTTIEANADDQNGVNVTYLIPKAIDSQGNPINGSVICKPPAHRIFPVGETRVNCTATDREGRNGTGSFMVRVIDDPPDTTITHAFFDGSNGTDAANMTAVPYTSSNRINFTFNHQDDIGRAYFECRIYTQDNKTAEFSLGEGFDFQSYSDLSVGIYSFQVRAVDTNLQPDISPARFTWVITDSK
jgi:HYR domain